MDEHTIFKSGFVAILGRPNVGKSTLLNKILGQKVAIVTPKPQTTRTRILGILHGENYQIVFVDTPGIHSPVHRLGEVLVENALRSARDSDINLFMLDAEDGITCDDIEAIEKVYRKSHAPLIMTINKIDLRPNLNIDTIANEISLIHKAEAIIAISALDGTNVNALVEKVLAVLPEGPPFFENDTITDQSDAEIAAEAIREKIMLELYQEVPYQTAVEIETIEPSENNAEILVIRANILVARPGQKALVLGKDGNRIKSIGIAAREELEKIFEQKVFLELWVKVKPDWFKKDRIISDLGYKR